MNKRRRTHNTNGTKISRLQRKLLQRIAAGTDDTWALRDGQMTQVQSLINMGLIWFGHREKFEITRRGKDALNDRV